jgi:antitoxin YefM
MTVFVRDSSGGLDDGGSDRSPTPPPSPTTSAWKPGWSNDPRRRSPRRRAPQPGGRRSTRSPRGPSRVATHPCGVSMRAGRLVNARTSRSAIRRTPRILVYAVRHTGVMSKTVPVREFRTHLAELLDEVADRREHVTVIRRGRPAAVLVPVDEYEALEETAEILSDEPTLAAIRRGLDDLAAGEVVSLDEVRAEHAAHGSSSPAPRVRHWPRPTTCAPARSRMRSVSSNATRTSATSCADGSPGSGRTGSASTASIRTPRRPHRARGRHPPPRQRVRDGPPVAPRRPGVARLLQHLGGGSTRYTRWVRQPQPRLG